MAGRFWGVNINQEDNYNDYPKENCTPNEQVSCRDLLARWLINMLITFVVLIILAVVVTYFGHNFTLETSRIYFITLLITLTIITAGFSILFCKRSIKPAHNSNQLHGTSHSYSSCESANATAISVADDIV